MGKIDETTVSWFEHEQKEYGTEVALKNFVFLIADGLMKDIGVTGTSVKYDHETFGDVLDRLPRN